MPGGGGGVVSAVQLDTPLMQEAGKSYSLRCRKKDGSSLVLSLQSRTGTSREVSLATPLPQALAPEAGDLVMFGESGQESVALVVKSIEPQGDLSARVTCVDAAPEIYLADQGEIPPFKSNISQSGLSQSPPAPEIVNVQSGEESLIRNADGSLTTRVVLTLRPPVYSYALDAQVLIRGEGEKSFVPADILSASPTQISIVGVEEGQRYDIQVRYIAENNNRSLPRLVSAYQVAGTTALPSAVSRLDISVVGDVAHLSWPAVSDIDLSHYCIRHAAMGSAAAWSNAVDMALRVPYDATTTSLPALPGYYLIKAVDVGGRMSEAAAMVRSPVSYLQGYNAILSVDEGAGFLGEKTGLTCLSGALCIDSLDELDAADVFDDIENIDTGESGLRRSGMYHFASVHDLGAVYTSRVSAVIGVQGLDMSTSVDQWNDVDINESWDSVVDPSTWSVSLQISCTDDDPALAVAVWSPWTGLTIGDYTARAYRFRLVLESTAMTVTPVVHALAVHIDMPDRYESAGDILHPPEGGAVTFSSSFRAKPVLQITPHDMQTGDYFTLAEVGAGGFFLCFFDSGGIGVARRFDYVAKGYGQMSAA